MKLLFLGVYSFMSVGKDIFQANMVLENKMGQRLLIDCGYDVKHSLYAQGYSYEDMDAVYISHLHSDHIGGLEWFGFANLFKKNRKIRLYISADQKDTLWQHALSAGMSSLQDEKAKLETYFDVQAIEKTFDWGGCHFDLIKTEHAFSNGKLLPSYGLLIHSEHKTILITSDTRHSPATLHPAYEKADLIFHDCELGGNSKQHARYEQLLSLDDSFKNKMWLYGYSSTSLPDATKDGFLGFVSQGQAFYF